MNPTAPRPLRPASDFLPGSSVSLPFLTWALIQVQVQVRVQVQVLVQIRVQVQIQVYPEDLFPPSPRSRRKT